MQIKEIEEITIRQMDNGYTVRIVYKDGKTGYSNFKNVVALNIGEVLDFVGKWCKSAEEAKEDAK